MQTAIKPRASKRVLIIDDDIDAAHTLSCSCWKWGTLRLTPRAGARRLHRRRSYGRIVFLDIGLPDLDGSEVAKQLRQTGGCEHALIIAVTGLGNEHRERMLQAGCDAYYVKPLDPKLIETFLSG